MSSSFAPSDRLIAGTLPCRWRWRHHRGARSVGRDAAPLIGFHQGRRLAARGPARARRPPGREALNEERVERRLAAILAADVAGYSRLMGVDEEGTLAALEAIRRDLLDLKIKEHR